MYADASMSANRQPKAPFSERHPRVAAFARGLGGAPRPRLGHALRHLKLFYDEAFADPAVNKLFNKARFAYEYRPAEDATRALAEKALAGVRGAAAALDKLIQEGNPSLPSLKRFASFRKEAVKLRGIIIHGSDEEKREACFKLWSYHGIYADEVDYDFWAATYRLGQEPRRLMDKAEGELSVADLIQTLSGKAEMANPLFIAPTYAFWLDEKYEQKGVYGANPLSYSQGLEDGVCWFIRDGERLIAPVTHTGTNPLQFVIAGPFEAGDEERIAEAAKVLAKISKNEVIVEYLDEGQRDRFIALGFKRWEEESAELMASDLDHPEVIIDVAQALEMRGGKYSKIRLALNSFKNWAGRENIEIERRGYGCVEDDFYRARELVKRWAADKAERTQNAGGEMDEAYLFRINMHVITGGGEVPFFPKREVRIILANGKPIGLSVLSPVDDETIGLYANITDTSVPGISEFLIRDALEWAAEKGYKRCNLGGSDSESLLAFKRKFNSVEEPKWYCVVYSSS